MKMGQEKMNLNEIANSILYHQRNAIETEKISGRYPLLTIEDAYKIQEINIENLLQGGDQLVGWKMGLTSIAKQQSVGVNQPIYGRLLKSMRITGDQWNLDGLIHPRVEPEFAFLINKKLEGNEVTEQDVWQATECIMPAVEVIDSRYRDFSFSLIDVIADNASSAKFLTSDQTFTPDQFQWEKVKVQMKVNGRLVQEGQGSAVMGNPVCSVVELVKMLHSSGHCVKPGMIVLTGGITAAINLNSGDLISVQFNQLGSINFKAK